MISAARSRVPPALTVSLAVLAIVVAATSVPGVFTVDESNYLVTVTGLRAGGLTVPGTAGLTPSNELAFFDPAPGGRAPRAPIGSTAPPLYAFLALPLSFLGWKGLVAVNAIAWSATALAVFALAARFAREGSTPWIALAAFLLGGYGLEYAQGVWPHALAACLATTGFFLASRARDQDRPSAALLAGLALGLATGVRYQNLVFAGAVGLGLLLFARRRLHASALFALGTAPCLAACSYINHVRLGSWNPISKGPGYLSPGPGRSLATILHDAPIVMLAKVIDYSYNPRPIDPRTGAFVFFGTVKKAWLQSSPWLLIALVALALAWGRRGASTAETRQLREIRAASFVFALTLASFAVAGFHREDGICYNQRYFLEMVPLGAVVLAWALEGRRIARPVFFVGALAGLAAALPVLRLDPGSVWRNRLELDVPLVLAIFLLQTFLPIARRFTSAVPFTVGAAIFWAAAIHVGSDVAASRSWRSGTAGPLADVRTRLPAGPAALVAYRPWADPFGPLLLGRDLVIVEPSIDGGASLPTVTGDLLGKGRRVFLLTFGMPQPVATSLAQGFSVRSVPRAAPVPLFEVSRP